MNTVVLNNTQPKKTLQEWKQFFISLKSKKQLTLEDILKQAWVSITPSKWKKEKLSTNHDVVRF